jgi:uroporphyrinogen decarboxylase
MTSRERVLSAINHEEPDRVPIVIGVSNATGIKMKAYRGIKKIFGIDAPDNYIYDWPELGTAEIDEATMQRLYSDVRGVLDSHPLKTLQRNQQRDPHSPFIDSWGIGQVELSPGEWFPGIHPLSRATTLEEIEAYPDWPDVNDPSRVAYVKETARRLAEQNEYAIMAIPWLLFPFERAISMQGMDVFLMNIALYPDFARALLHKITEVCKLLIGPFLEELGDNVDIIKIGDDLGTQDSLIISPEMYRDILKPLHADFIQFIKARSKAKIFFHSDGDVSPIIDDFIEIGVDILNPIQTSAGKMGDLEGLKKRYGKNLVFCGGIDTQSVLQCGTPETVRKEVQRVMKILGPGGGFMVAAVHTVMNDVPPQNVLAMVDTVIEFGNYPIGSKK